MSAGRLSPRRRRFDWKYLQRILTGLGRALVEIAKERPSVDYSSDVALLERAAFEVRELKKLEERADASEAAFLADEQKLIDFVSSTYGSR